MAKMKSGWTDYVGPRVRSERALVKGIMKDARSFGVRSPGKSAKSNNARKSTKASSNIGSFGKQ